MLKRLLLSGTALVALSTMAMAQAATPPGPAPSRPGSTMGAPATTGMAPSQTQSKNEPVFTNYKGADVLGSDGKSIGAVADVIIDSQGDVKQLILSHGGVIGIGSTLNAYDVQKLPELNDGKVKLGLTTASLDQLPKFEYPSGSGNAPAEGRASTSTSAPMAGSSGASPTTANGVKADQSAMNSAADNAASTAAATSASGSMWPVSYLVGADIKKGDKSAAISDARFEGGKLSAVIVNDGTDLGLGKGQQQIAFNELSISGTPKKPDITLSGSGMGASAPPSTSAPAGSSPPPSTGTAPSSGSSSGSGGMSH
ncbi:MAG TPA: PRC-barrel domain-containing protein [Hyphomicrobiales bacterium]|nr:PRC-barrel domain-containing protein [Hyphomicrobiales bacterium]